MAGSGYDVSASSARSSASGVENQANTYFSFGGSSVTTGDSGQSQTQTPTATSTAATGSPGAGNGVGSLPASGQANIQQGYTPPKFNNSLLIFSAIIIAAIIIHKK